MTILRHIVLTSFVLLLTACVNYHGIHSQETAIDPSQLHLPTTNIKIDSQTALAANNWWQQFHDPQLNQLIDVALNNSPDIQMAAARLRIAEQHSQAAQASLWPSLSADGAIQHERFSENSIYPPPLGGQVVNAGNAGINFNYSLDWLGKNQKLWAAAKNETLAATENMHVAQLAITTEVAKTYFALQSSLQDKQRYQNIVQQQQKALTLTQARLNKGLDSQFPVSNFTNNLTQATIALSNVEKTIALQRDALAALLGKDPTSTTDIVKVSDKTLPEPALPSSLPANLLAHRPDIAALKYQVLAADNQVAASKTEFFPNINLTGSYQFESLMLSNLLEHRSLSMAYGPAIDLPIFDANARRADLGSKYAEYDEKVAEYNRGVVSAMREVNDSVATLRGLQQQIKQQKISLNTVRLATQLSNARYQQGLDNAIQRAQAQTNYLQQENLMTDVTTQYLLALVDMIKALGGGYGHAN